MRTFLIVWLWSAALLAQAQQRKPDLIVKTDLSRLSGYVVRITEIQVYYRPSLKADSPLRSIPRELVDRIRYGSGRIVVLSKKNPPTSVKAPIPVPDPAPQAPVQAVSAPPPVVIQTTRVADTPDTQPPAKSPATAQSISFHKASFILTIGGLLSRKGIPDYEEYLPETSLGLFVAADVSIRTYGFVGVQYLLWQNKVAIADRVYWNRVHAPAGRIGLQYPTRWVVPYGVLASGLGFSTLRGSYTRQEVRQKDFFFSAGLGLRGVLPLRGRRKLLSVSVEKGWGKLNYLQTGIALSL